MIAISVKQPWAYLLCAGIKGVENRTWKLPEKYKGKMILIHASAKTDKEPYMLFNDAQIEAIGNDIMDVVASYHNTSAIIGSVVFTDCVINHPSMWADRWITKDWHNGLFGGTYDIECCNWVASNPILFDTPIPAKGKLSFWDFPNIKSEKDEGTKEICCCNLGIPEKQQVLSYGNGDFRCIYCGGKWYK